MKDSTVPDPDLNGPCRIWILKTIHNKSQIQRFLHFTSRDVIQNGSLRFRIPLAPNGSGSGFIEMIMVKI